MSVRDDRLPPFAWLALDDLERIRRELPAALHVPARNALLALAEAASRRRDGQHRNGDTLSDLSRLSGVSERRLRGHLRELARIGLVGIEESFDEHNRPRPTIYVLLAGPDATSGYRDAASGYPDAPAPERPGLRARVEGQERETLFVEPQDARDARDGGLNRPTIEETAEHVRGVLQRGVDGLTGDVGRPVARGAILEALRRNPLVPDLEARTIAVEVRSIAQSQNRAPNIAGLYASRLDRRTAEIAASPDDAVPAAA